MSFNDTIDLIGDVVAWLIGPPILAFMLLYRAYSRWRYDPLGIERMWTMTYLFLLWLLIMAGNFLPDAFDTARLTARILLFVTIVVGLWIQVINLRRVQTNSPRPLFFTWLTYRAQRERRARRRAR